MADGSEILREIRNAQQVPGEPRRRWFFSHKQDLIVWFGEDAKPVAFQLCYGKYRDEHAIRWKAGRGFVHHRVDDGEITGMVKQAALLVADGAFEAAHVLNRFLELSGEVPRDLVDFVSARLREHPEYRKET